MSLKKQKEEKIVHEAISPKGFSDFKQLIIQFPGILKSK